MLKISFIVKMGYQQVREYIEYMFYSIKNYVKLTFMYKLYPVIYH